MVAAFPLLVADSVDLLETGNYTRTPQAHLAGSYFPQRGPGDEWIDWSDSSINIYNKIRALAKLGPGALTSVNDVALNLWSARYELEWPRYIANPGQIIGVEEDGGLRIKTGDSTLIVTDYSFSDLHSSEKLNCLRIGTKLGLNLALLHQERRVQRSLT